MLDGLAFRYYWATDGLTESDLSYTPGNGGRTLYQTLNHIYNMVDFAGNIVAGYVTQFPEIEHNLTFSTLRGETLNRIEEIKHQCLELPENVLKERRIKGESDGNPFEMPLLYFFNGPLPETFYHLGQIVSFRRTLGNPIDQHVQQIGRAV